MAAAAVCDLSITLEAVHGRVLVDLRCDGKSMGELSAYDVLFETLSAPCRRELSRARRRTGAPLDAYVVFWSKLHERLRGTGIGVAMYLAAAEGASRLGGALVQHACFFDPDEGDVGTTSGLARNVWEASRFHQHALVFGDVVAYMPQSQWGSAQAMLGFGQLDIPMRNRHGRKR